MRSACVWFAAAVVMASACGADAPDATPDPGAPADAPDAIATAQPTPPEEAPMPEQPVPQALQAAVSSATADLSERLSVSQDQIEVVRAEHMVWPDGGLGCPQPGMSYTQVQVDGALIELRHGQQTYRYHSGGNRGPFLCQRPARRPDPGGPADR